MQKVTKEELFFIRENSKALTLSSLCIDSLLEFECEIKNGEGLVFFDLESLSSSLIQLEEISRKTRKKIESIRRRTAKEEKAIGN